VLKKILYLILVYFVVFSNFCYAKTILEVFHAGSLAVPFSKMEAAFEKKYPYIDVRRQPSGSVKAIRKVTDLHKKCDVIAVADYSLIPKMLFPKFADHVKLFARNELVLCYSKNSKYASKINKDNWYKILGKDGVKWGFSNPNDDPCGYRTVISIGLASFYYKQSEIIKQLLGKFTNIKWKQNEDELLFTAPSDLKTKTQKIFIRHKSVELLGLLESGAIDYAFEYKSVALQHKLLFVKFPPQINLGNLKYSSFYKRCKIRLANGKIIRGKPIVYGIAALKNSLHPKEAILWEEFVTSEIGKKILIQCNQTPIFPAKEIKNK
jgi:molybdate/tungstate transport system substrate-binding protein